MLAFLALAANAVAGAELHFKTLPSDAIGRPVEYALLGSPLTELGMREFPWR